MNQSSTSNFCLMFLSLVPTFTVVDKKFEFIADLFYITHKYYRLGNEILILLILETGARICSKNCVPRITVQKISENFQKKV